jgi:hypothetical protein
MDNGSTRSHPKPEGHRHRCHRCRHQERHRHHHLRHRQWGRQLQARRCQAPSRLGHLRAPPLKAPTSQYPKLAPCSSSAKRRTHRREDPTPTRGRAESASCWVQCSTRGVVVRVHVRALLRKVHELQRQSGRRSRVWVSTNCSGTASLNSKHMSLEVRTVRHHRCAVQTARYACHPSLSLSASTPERFAIRLCSAGNTSNKWLP